MCTWEDPVNKLSGLVTSKANAVTVTNALTFSNLFNFAVVLNAVDSFFGEFLERQSLNRTVCTEAAFQVVAVLVRLIPGRPPQDSIRF